MKKIPVKILCGTILSIALLFIYSCKQWENFITYFNTYYNMERLIGECEDEFGFLDDKKRVKPRVIIPEPKLYIPSTTLYGVPNFMEDFVISSQQSQPVNVKLDSIEIKGSKILAFHSKSKYVEGTLFLMSKAYFYRNDWINSQIKCSELIDRYPDGDWSPDAHLLMSKNYLIQRKFHAGKLLLSRTVDIAWQKDRYDILSEAFRLQAELALYENDMDGALKPYKQAIAQSEDNDMKAKWQVDLASLLFRMSKFEKAERAFAKVRDYSPDYLAEFESYLYQASCFDRLGKYDKAEKLLDDLESNRNNNEWMAWIFAERMNSLRLKKQFDQLPVAEKVADSAYIGNTAISGVYFETGMDYFQANEYSKARNYFSRARAVRTTMFRTADRMYVLLNTWEQKRTQALPDLLALKSGKDIGDTARSTLAMNLFEIGRVHEQLGNLDSSVIYYKLAVESSPQKDSQTARFLYAYSRSIKDVAPIQADSLMELIVEKYPYTPYGKDAMKQKGYTEIFLIDTVAELYNSGDRSRKYGDNVYAIKQFSTLYITYPKSDYAPKSIYSIGWIYENVIRNFDSALFYYQILIEKYPQSQYALDVRLSVDYLLALRNGGPLPDTLKPKVVVKYIAKPPAPDVPLNGLPIPQSKQNQEKKGGFNPMDLLNDPGKMLKGAKDMISNPENMIKDMKLPTNPMDLLKSMKDDSTGVKQDSLREVEPIHQK